MQERVMHSCTEENKCNGWESCPMKWLGGYTEQKAILDKKKKEKEANKKLERENKKKQEEQEREQKKHKKATKKQDNDESKEVKQNTSIL